MADANPSRPVISAGNASTSKIEQNLKANEQIGRRKDGRVVRRTTMTNGNIRDDFLNDAEHADAPLLDAPKVEKPDPRPVSKAKAPAKAKKGS